MKEIYKVQTPKRIVFGDPLYFEEFSGARLEQLVVDVQPPEAFGARVVLREFSAAEAPDTLIRTMEVYLAPEEDMDIYLRGMKYELQECIEKEIGVDTARYYLQVDDREDILHTGGDGYWGSYEELSRNTRDGRMVEAAILTVIWPEYESMESMRQHAFFFSVICSFCRKRWKKRTTNHKYTARRGSGYDALSARNAAKAGPAGLCRAV
jgi:hypothetical protein